MSSLESMEKQLMIALAGLDAEHKEISYQPAAIEADIHNSISRLHRILDVRKAELVRQLYQLTETKLKNLEAQRDEIETTQAQLNSCLLDIREQLKVGNQGEVLMKSTVVSQVRKLTTTFQPDMLEPNTEADMIFKTLGDLKTECQNYGEVCVYASALVLPVLTVSEVKGPMGIAVNQKGEVVVTEYEKYCVTAFSHSGEKLRSFGQQGTDHGQFESPHGVAVDAKGNILVADSHNHRIQKFTAQGELLAVGGSKQYQYPYGIAFNASNDRVYVLCGNGGIQILNSDNLSYWGTFGGEKGNGKGQFNNPKHIACDSTGKVYVADSGNNRIQVFTAGGKYLRMFGRRGKGGGKLYDPWGVAIDSSGRVYVSEGNNHRVSVFTSEGQFVTSFGSEGEGAGQFKHPRGNAIANLAFRL